MAVWPGRSSMPLTRRPQLPTFWTTLPQRFWLVTLSEYHNFSTNVNNEFRFGFNRYSQFFPVGNQTFPGLGTFPNLQCQRVRTAFNLVLIRMLLRAPFRTSTSSWTT